MRSPQWLTVRISVTIKWDVHPATAASRRHRPSEALDRLLAVFQAAGVWQQFLTWGYPHSGWPVASYHGYPLRGKATHWLWLAWLKPGIAGLAPQRRPKRPRVIKLAICIATYLLNIHPRKRPENRGDMCLQIRLSRLNPFSYPENRNFWGTLKDDAAPKAWPSTKFQATSATSLTRITRAVRATWPTCKGVNYMPTLSNFATMIVPNAYNIIQPTTWKYLLKTPPKPWGYPEICGDHWKSLGIAPGHTWKHHDNSASTFAASCALPLAQLEATNTRRFGSKMGMEWGHYRHMHMHIHICIYRWTYMNICIYMNMYVCIYICL
jgi:hypothetical protein